MRQVVFSIFCILACTCYVNGDNLSTKGKWGDDRLRNVVPAPPVAYLLGNTVQIYLEDPLENLQVIFTDRNGMVIYSEIVTSDGPNYTYDIPYEFPSGEYTLKFLHHYGELVGDFTVD